MVRFTLNTMLSMGKDFDRLMDAAEILKKWDSQAEVARQLGVDDQTMTNWKARGVPRQRITEISKKIGCNPFWLEDGEGIMEFIYAKTQAEARVVTAMQKMEAAGETENVATVIKISDSLAEQAKPKNNGTK